MPDLWSYLGRPFLRAHTLGTGPILFPLPSRAEPNEHCEERQEPTIFWLSTRLFFSFFFILLIYLFIESYSVDCSERSSGP
jgi:hypothetical protein